METTLFETTIKLLRENRGRFRTISDETGLDYNWLHKLSQGEINDPGVKKIERLNRYLVETKGDAH